MVGGPWPPNASGTARPTPVLVGQASCLSFSWSTFELVIARKMAGRDAGRHHTGRDGVPAHP